MRPDKRPWAIADFDDRLDETLKQIFPATMQSASISGAWIVRGRGRFPPLLAGNLKVELEDCGESRSNACS